MNGIYFVPSTLGFIPEKWKSDGTYKEAGWPRDAVLLTDEERATYQQSSPPPGKRLGAADGRPVWVDLPSVTRDQILAIRLGAYRNESDPLKVEAEYDAQIAGVEPDYSAWVSKVQEIKARYPLPE